MTPRGRARVRLVPMRIATVVLGMALALCGAVPASASPEKLPPGVVERV